MSENSSITLPLLITRGFIAFPNNISSIEAARDFSTKAIEVSRNEQSSLILIVAQKDPSIDNPSLDDIYSVGSLCRITSFSDQKNIFCLCDWVKAHIAEHLIVFRFCKKEKVCDSFFVCAVNHKSNNSWGEAVALIFF